MTTTPQPAPSSPTSTKADDFIVVTNPATGEEVGRLPRTPREQVAEVVARAREAQKEWGARSFDERSAVIRRFHDSLFDHWERLLDTIQTETGKTRRDALGEVVTVAGQARYYIAHGKHHLRDRKRQPAVPGLTSAQVVHKPLGVTGQISPWNFPFILPIGDGIPSLLAGNAVVTKPSELTPLSCELGRELLVAAGLPADLFGLVHGDGPVVGAELIQHVDAIGFTGSTPVGRQVGAAAGERLIPCSLELGGKNPMVVLREADVDDAVIGLASGAFANTGQTCICVEKVFVEEAIYDEFVEKAALRAQGMKVGWSLDWDMDMGSLISTDHADKVWSHVEDAKAKGATVLAGGSRRPDLGPAFLAPTILADVTPEMELFAEETFGPVVSIQKVASAEEAVRWTDQSPYGLNASVWGDGDRAYQVARRLETGTANVNSTLLVYHSFDVPMGGIKASGLGRRHGEHGILRHTQEQSVVGSFSTGGGYEAILGKMRSKGIAKKFLRAVRLWRHLPFIR